MTYTKDEIKKMVRRYVTLRNKLSDIETEMKLIKKALIECLKDVPDKKMDVGKRTISVSDCSKRTVSFEALHKEHPEIAEKFMKVSTYKQLNVK